MVDEVKFYAALRTEGLFNKMSQQQVDSVDAILDESESQGISDNRQIAYLLATAYHEAFNPKHPETRLTPITEFGGEAYLKSKKYYPYYGRGFSQLTWVDNYNKESKRLNLDLVNHPELMLEIPTAANSHVYCMAHGVYTTHKLSDYINDSGCDFIAARKIVNGTDQAELIAGYANKFLNCLQ